MYTTLMGLLMVVVGSAIILFSDRIARFYEWLHRSTLGIELPRPWQRAGNIAVGGLMAFYGLLVLFRLVTIK